MKKWFYERNDELLNSELNVTFETVLTMTDDEFRQWCIDLRKLVVKLWDEHGKPPRVGLDEDDIVDNLSGMLTFQLDRLEYVDADTNEKNVLRNTTNIGSAINQWFPTMMKTKITQRSKGNARSIYDYFADDDLLETFITYSRRHFKQDSFYSYSQSVSYGDEYFIKGYHKVEKFSDTVKFFASGYKDSGFGYYLCPIQEKPSYTGYNEKQFDRKTIRGELKVYGTRDHSIDGVPLYLLSPSAITLVNPDKPRWYTIKTYRKGQKLFPEGFKAFRMSYAQYATNFPPLIAKYLYTKYTSHINDEPIMIYDPSAGWGGRLIGALSITDKCVHYFGTDPNKDHITENNRTKYDELADFFIDRVLDSGKLYKHENKCEIQKTGSEVIDSIEEFRAKKGNFDLVFTSPPYFNKEVYSADKEQSCHSYPNYQDWVDNFLYPTLKIAVESLKNDRYLLWNIANVSYDGGKVTLPLEEDSMRILKELGMNYVKTYKMALTPMQGANRIVNGKGTAKNSVRVKNGKKVSTFKFEPIFVFHKP